MSVTPPDVMLNERGVIKVSDISEDNGAATVNEPLTLHTGGQPKAGFIRSRGFLSGIFPSFPRDEAERIFALYRTIPPPEMLGRRERTFTEFVWRPQGDSNPRYRRERAMS